LGETNGDVSLNNSSVKMGDESLPPLMLREGGQGLGFFGEVNSIKHLLKFLQQAEQTSSGQSGKAFERKTNQTA
jgi:hypothetical protein